MAAQPPTEKPKPWYQRPLQVALISGGILLVLGLIANATFGGDKASSDGASISATHGDNNLTVEGSGWKGDSAVTIGYPYQPGHTAGTEKLVSPDGTFSFTGITVGLGGELRRLTVTVTGKQTGHRVTKTFTAL